MENGSERPLRDVVRELTPVQEHFLKKYILEVRLTQEIIQVNSSRCCELLGPPFATDNPALGLTEVPLLRFLFANFAKTFPYFAANLSTDLAKFWQKTVQRFMDNLHSLNEFDANSVCMSQWKQHVNKTLLSGLLVFFNALIVTKKDMEYSTKNVEGAKEQTVGGFQSSLKASDLEFGIYEYTRMKFSFDTSTNIVAVRKADCPQSRFLKLKSLSGTSQKHHYEFIIQVNRRVKTDENSQYKSHFISRSYQEFRVLESTLKNQFPGLMETKIPPLANEIKHDDGIDFDGGTHGQSVQYFREKLRIFLRGWLSSLMEYPDIFHSETLQRFIDSPLLNFDTLPDEEMKDCETRMDHERKIIKTQQEFQIQTSQILADFVEEFDKFKNLVVKDPGVLDDAYREVSKTNDIKKSPIKLLKLLNEWVKYEMGATFYEWYFVLDNSTIVLDKSVKMNKYMPRGLIYNIFKFTNPVQMIQKGLDLLFLPLPSLSLHRWGWGKKNHLEDIEEPGSKNLLSLVFSTLVEDHMGNYNKELKELRNDRIPEDFGIFIDRIQNYYKLPSELCYQIQDEAYDNSKDLLLTVLKSDLVAPKLNTEYDRYRYDEIVSSYEAYQKIGEVDEEDFDLYLAFKQYWQLELRMKEKKAVRLLWQNPAVTNLIRGFMMILYRPLLRIMSKAQMHVAYRNFYIFIDDVLDESVKLNKGGKYHSDPHSMMTKLISIISKHENTMWNFFGDIHKQDSQNKLKTVLDWGAKYLRLINTKYVDRDLVDLDLENLDIVVQKDRFVEQLNARIKYHISRRQIFKDYRDEKNMAANVTRQDTVNFDWDRIHNDINGTKIGQSLLGVDAEDIEEFNNLIYEQGLPKEDIGGSERNLRQKLYQLRNSSEHETSELDKLDEVVKPRLSSMMKQLELRIFP